MMTLAGSRAKCQAGGGPLERRVRRHLRCYQLTPPSELLLQMTRFDWRRAPVVVSTVSEANRRFDEFGWIGVVKSRQLYGNIVAANLSNMATCERAYAAMLAKQMMANLVVELIVS
jgi:hypothetical protein